MRTLLLAMLMASAALSAHAAAIENVKSGQIGDENSIIHISCGECSSDARKGRYQVPSLKGVASMEIVNEDGKAEVIRVDKFLGGSPVKTTSTAQVPLIEGMEAAELKAFEAKQVARRAELQAIDMKTASILPPDDRRTTAIAGIDRETTTAALGEEASTFDPAKLQLRLR